jgi:hypothetical protein
LQEVYLNTLDEAIDDRAVYYFYDSEAEEYFMADHEDIDMTKRDK